MRASRLVVWVGLMLFAAFGLLVLDSTQLLRGRERSATALFVPALEAVSTVLDGAGGFAQTVGDIGHLRAQNQALSAENENLRTENVQARQVLRENEQLKALLGFEQQHVTHHYQAARVIGLGSNNLLPMVTLDQGSSAGLKPGMSVVASGGLVGRIINVGDHWSNVLPINNPSSSVAVVISGTTGPATGILQMEPSKGLSLGLVPATERLQAGSWVLTSGVGGGFPPNIPVGIIVSSDQQDVALFQTATVQPAVDFLHSQDALVVTDFVPIHAPSSQ